MRLGRKPGDDRCVSCMCVCVCLCILHTSTGSSSGLRDVLCMLLCMCVFTYLHTVCVTQRRQQPGYCPLLVIRSSDLIA
ncbi:hypothetical protein F5Y10DRAFT_244856 [Nemania abortiva]|nr:hypothetical protein F5Y10DRAFT_244856 [Nemania abortiva]